MRIDRVQISSCHFSNFLTEALNGYDKSVAQRFAKLHVPDLRSERDALLAATALVHGMTVATRNIVDFKATSVEILNPWEFSKKG